MANAKVIWVVEGSEDGVLGVASNLKAATDIAISCEYEIKYSDVLKEHKKTSYIALEVEGGSEVSIMPYMLKTGRKGN